MSLLMRASEIAKRPVVTLLGEDVAQIKDIVYADGGGQIGGFTLNGRGRLSGPMKVSLAWGAVVALGPDAVMIEDESVLVDRHEFLTQEVEPREGSAGRGGGDILGSRVLTDAGRDLGKVLDVIIEIRPAGNKKGPGAADVVGYEIEPTEDLGKDRKKVLVPLPDTLAASGEHLVVPASAVDFVTNDLAGFGAAMEDFRSQLSGGR
jgi:sporulation protein YlmC with PRC-barrel domain